MTQKRCSSLHPTRTVARSAIKAVLAALAGAVCLLGVGGATAHAAVSINCSVPLNVQCTVSAPEGIKTIKVQLNTALGTIDVVDNSYSCVTSTTVSWDPIVPGGDILVATCNGGLVPPKSANGWGQKGGKYYTQRDGSIAVDESINSLDTPRAGIDYAMRTPLRVDQSTTPARAKLYLPLVSSFAPPGNSPELIESASCCYDGTNNCFSVNLLAVCGEGLYFKYCSTNSNGQEECTTYPN